MAGEEPSGAPNSTMCCVEACALACAASSAVALVGDEAMAVANPLPIVGTIAPGRDMRPSSSVSLGQQKARPPPSVSV